MTALDKLRQGWDTYQATGMPHQYCLINQPHLVDQFVIADLIIFGSYVCISLFMLVYGVKAYRLRHVPQAAFLLFYALFIFLCGLTHAGMAALMFAPLYNDLIILWWATALVSLIVAGFLVVARVTGTTRDFLKVD